MRWYYWFFDHLLITLFQLVNCSMDVCDNGNECRALLPYNVRDAIIPEFHQATKSVTLVDGTIIDLVQDWNNNGVAGVVWDSARVLANYLITYSALVVGKRVLALGAGTGLTSLAAGYLNAAHVTATDLPIACELLQRNVERNADTLKLPTDKITVTPLNWGSAQQSSSSAWYDLIIGADLVYDKNLFESLKSTLLELTSSKEKGTEQCTVGDQVVVLMASKIRYPKDRHFYRDLKSHFSVQRVLYDVESDVGVYQIIRL